MAALAAVDPGQRPGPRTCGLRGCLVDACIAACRPSTALSPDRQLAAEATIERDARGIPVITARSRADLAFATGFAHAQDRFFQMDLSRRFAAGELSELFGEAALEQDIRVRRFGFPRRGAPRDRGGARRRTCRRRGLHARRECRAREPRDASLGIPAVARQPARMDAGRFGAGGALDVVATAVQHADR